MSALYYKGENINTAPITPIVSITQAEYDGNKTYYDSLDSIIEITDSTNNGGNASNVKYGATDVASALDTINTSLPSKMVYGDLVVENANIFSGSIAANNYSVGTKTVSKSGYMPIGIVGFLFGGSAQGWTYASNIYIQSASSGSCVVGFALHNCYSSAISTTFDVRILWAKIK